ncbi:GSCOCG00004831001-RA-CDS, partial [Cotesia congregata]
NNVKVPKLPAGTIIVKKEDKKPKLQSRNASNIESIIGKIKSMKKMDKTKTEVQQRVPLQGVKKKNDDNFSRLRLLAAKRRGCRNDGGIKKKQLKKCNVPHMNTRSITKKLYNVGAAYQPPTVSDEMEWKEWPVHG